MITLYVQNIHCGLTHLPAVACGSLSQSCQWLSPVGRPNQLECTFKLGYCLSRLLQLVIRLQHSPKPDKWTKYVYINWQQIDKMSWKYP